MVTVRLPRGYSEKRQVEVGIAERGTTIFCVTIPVERENIHFVRCYSKRKGLPFVYRFDRDFWCAELNFLGSIRFDWVRWIRMSPQINGETLDRHEIARISLKESESFGQTG